jgi:type II secretory pathway pseudopilin PulG
MELLVVISIIGILSAILYANFTDARIAAKNKSLQSELKEVSLALEVYKSQNSHYPILPAGSSINDYTYDLWYTLIPEFIADMPVKEDSSNSACDITYVTDATGSYYKITAAECAGGINAAADGVHPASEFARCPINGCGVCASDTYDSNYILTAPFYESYAVYSVGGECK